MTNELTPEEAIDKLVMQLPQDVCRVVVVVRSPGLSEDQKARIAGGVTQVIGDVMEFKPGDELQVDYLVQTNVVGDDNPEGGGEK